MMSLNTAPALAQQPVAVTMTHAHTQGLGGPSSNSTSGGGGCCGNNSASVRASLGSPDTKAMRGEMTGDYCLAIDLFTPSPTAAVWKEEENLPVTLVSKEEATKSTDDSIRRLFCMDKEDTLLEKSLAQLIDHYAQLYFQILEKSNSTDATEKKQKKKKLKNKSLTLVVPCGLDQIKLRSILNASKQVDDVFIKNFFERGVSVVAGILYRSATLKQLLAAAAPASPIVLYLNIEFSSDECINFEACLVQCEEGRQARETGNVLGFERLCAVATTSGKSEMMTSSKRESLAKLLKDVWNAVATEDHLSGIRAMVIDGGACSSEDITILGEALNGYAGARVVPVPDEPSFCSPFSISTFAAHSGDSATGATLLSAAELDSSKQYLLLDDGWKIAFQLPTADCILNVDVAVEVEDSLGTVSLLGTFNAKTRLRKTEFGNTSHLEAETSSLIREEFHWGSVYLNNRTVGFPKVHLLQRTKATEPWKRIGSYFPLAKKENKNSEFEPVERCVITIEADSSTGVVRVTESKGETVAQVREKHVWIFQLFFFILLPILLYGVYRLYGFFQNKYTMNLHKAWLLDFYKRNSPDKVIDDAFISKTLRKYEGKMFLLWRALEKSYNVKCSPPSGVLEEL